MIFENVANYQSNREILGLIMRPIRYRRDRLKNITQSNWSAKIWHLSL